MKQLYTLFILIPFLLVNYTNSVQASAPSLPEDDFLCGDVNEDGIVNVLDIITLVNYVMEGNPDPFSEEAADVNADGIINVLDIIALVNIIMQVPGLPCGCVAPVLYEGQTYSTVQIGDQCWFKENLNAGVMINSNTGGQLQTNNEIMEKYCYGNDAANCNLYGGLYEWNEAMQYLTTEGTKGICPVGWHVPSDFDYTALTNYLGGLAVSGGKMKEAGLIHWAAPNSGATNESGFTALPGGYRDSGNGTFNDQTHYSFLWSSTQNTDFMAWYRQLSHGGQDVYRNYNMTKDLGLTVRCLKGCWPLPSQANAGPDQLDIPGTSTTLAGNTPEFGNGLWAIVSGTGGTILAPASPTSEFQGVAGNAYTLSWTITTQCGSSSDTVLISFTAGGPFTCGEDLEYEGQSYPTILIGSQCWIAENLNVGTRISSTQGGFQQTNNGTVEKYCYDNNETNCDIYGGLYEWPEAMQYMTTEGAQGICPAGWHIATDNEWKILEGTVDSQYGVGDPVWDNTVWRGYDAGGNLKETGFSHWNDPNTGATNSSGFTGLPGGYRYYYDGYSYYASSNGYFWSSSQMDGSSAWFRSLDYGTASVYRLEAYKDYGFSVRCLRDCLPQPSQSSAGPDQLNLPGTSTTLAGNTPTYGTGLWTIVSGTGGTIVTPTSPTSEFQGIAGNEYSLTWTITTQCGSSADTVVISFAGSTFTCGDNLVYEGQSYSTVLIGTQCWMAENLNVGTRVNSTEIGGFEQYDNGITEKYCYNNDEAYCDIYGGLYEWNEAMQYETTEGAQGICPGGWHIPTDNEWKILEGMVDSQYGVDDPEWDDTGWRGYDAGGNLKEAGTIHWLPPNTSATNSSGFTGLPGGYRHLMFGGFYYITTWAHFWTSSVYSSSHAWYRFLTYNKATVNRNVYYKAAGYSVRCVIDD